MVIIKLCTYDIFSRGKYIKYRQNTENTLKCNASEIHKILSKYRRCVKMYFLNTVQTLNVYLILIADMKIHTITAKYESPIKIQTLYSAKITVDCQKWS